MCIKSDDGSSCRLTMFDCIEEGSYNSVFYILFQIRLPTYVQKSSKEYKKVKELRARTM